mmetsp:Transcript_42979/g.123297  ORF Transcript_42979/g.123297 Transcript_42979/m.123297 type:complete len:294 (+) Transcript_42979:991-1872(+)
MPVLCGDVERRGAGVGLRLLDVRARAYQRRQRRNMAVLRRNPQRGRAHVGSGQVQIGLHADQSIHDLAVALLRREVQRRGARVAAGDIHDGAGLDQQARGAGVAAPRDGVEDRASVVGLVIRIRAAVQQRLDLLRVADADRLQHERALLAGLLPRVLLAPGAARLGQQLDDGVRLRQLLLGGRGLLGGARAIHRRLAAAVSQRVDVRLGRQQQPHGFAVGAVGCGGQRRLAVVLLRLHVGPCLQQRQERSAVALARRHERRGGARVRPGQVHVRPVLQEHVEDLGVALLHGEV